MAASGDGREPAAAVIAAAKVNTNIELLHYEALTHFGPLEDPDGMAADVVAWIAANCAG